MKLTIVLTAAAPTLTVIDDSDIVRPDPLLPIISTFLDAPVKGTR